MYSMYRSGDKMDAVTPILSIFHSCERRQASSSSALAHSLKCSSIAARFMIMRLIRVAKLWMLRYFASADWHLDINFAQCKAPIILLEVDHDAMLRSKLLLFLEMEDFATAMSKKSDKSSILKNLASFWLTHE